VVTFLIAKCSGLSDDENKQKLKDAVFATQDEQHFLKLRVKLLRI
jgi:hypothetical protein